MTTFTLTKHHGLGNDFLVLDTAHQTTPAERSSFARRVCDRRRGIGADGLLLLARDACASDRLWMVLHNADGSRAEMSGNGIRCLAQAAFRAEGRAWPVRYTVATDAGARTVEVAPTEDAATVLASVDMGAPTPGRAPAGWNRLAPTRDRRVAHVDLGNPHTVIGVDDVDSIDLAALGARMPGVNLEVVAPGPGPSSLVMRVHERGVGATEACGTGACAAARAAAAWGLVEPSDGEITVHMVGGDAIVRLDRPVSGHITLAGPATFIATIQWEA